MLSNGIESKSLEKSPKLENIINLENFFSVFVPSQEPNIFDSCSLFHFTWRKLKKEWYEKML